MLLVALKLQLTAVKSMDLGSGKFNLRLKAQILKSCKPQAAGLTVAEGYYRINLKGEIWIQHN